jgi:co-chaperonin GroES (HSP10)
MIEPVGVMVLVEPIEVKAVTAGGIHLPDQVVEKDQWATQRGTILAVGPRAEYLGQNHVGKVAIFGRYAGAMIEHEGKKYRLIDNQDIKALEA